VTLGVHAVFIVGAYAAAALVVLALIAWVVADHRVQKRTLAELDRAGAGRGRTPG
jgi:heme exporter protein CcmD